MQSSLNDALEERRIELDMTWRQVADAAGISLAGLGAIRRGERHPSALTVRRIENALEWTPGSVEAILGGSEPTPVESRESVKAEDNPEDEDVEQLMQRVRRMPREDRRALLRLLRASDEMPGRTKDPPREGQHRE